jgi:methyl-accepting chemotaxis protein
VNKTKIINFFKTIKDKSLKTKKDKPLKTKKSKSLKTKMLLYFVIMITVILAVMGFIITTNVRGQVTKLNEDLTKQVVLARASEIGKYVEGLVNEATQWSDRDVMLLGNTWIIASDLEKNQENLRSDFEMSFFADPTGAAVTSLGSEMNIADRAYFDEIINGGKEFVISDPLVSKSTGKTVFVVAHVVKNEVSGRLIGLFGVTVTLDTFNNVINNIVIGNGGYPWIIDSTGLIIAHPDESYRMALSTQNSAESGFKGLSEIGEKMLAGEQGVGQYTGATEGNIFATYAPIPNTPGWSMAYSMPELEMMSAVNGMIGAIIIIVLISVAVVAGLTFVISGSIVKPVKSAADLAQALASGNLDKTIEVRTDDEVGRLARLLDKDVRQAFKDIEQAHLVSEKQAKYQSDEVGKLLVNLERLSRGELNCDIVVAEADADTQELYTLFSGIAANLSGGLAEIKGYINQISSVLGEMSHGNLDVGIEAEYKGDFATLKKSINSIVLSLNEVMGEINAAADQVAAGTVQVSEGSQTISRGATEQASSIEELAASATQIAQQTQHNAKSAQKANELSEAAAANAMQGNDLMKAMQQAMVEINDSSRSIGKIIKVIDDIAFQTNILALNAAVEAARAGVHGKGFAVVAEEVRNLAARSATAAKETTEMIEGSIQKTAFGKKIADETAASLASIVAGTQKAAQLVGEIAIASNEQATAIEQTNRGIDQLSAIVQSNSATSEEAAAASEELASQADFLKSMVEKFKLKDTELKSEESNKELQQKPLKGKGLKKDYESAKPIFLGKNLGKY